MPLTDEQLPRFCRELGIPGLADIHVHFLPERMLDKVWAYFDTAGERLGRPWPIQYRLPEPDRLRIARRLGLRAIPSLTYPHKPGMARWLNEWCADFAARVPDAVHSATLYPEPDAPDYLARALAAGARLIKMHVQVGAFAPDDHCWIRAGNSCRRRAYRSSSTAVPARSREPSPGFRRSPGSLIAFPIWCS